MPSNPNHKEALNAFEQGRFEEAVELFAKTLGEEESSELWNDWATAQFQLGRVEEAEEGYRRAIELDVNNISTALNLGVLLKQVGRAGDAIPWLEKVAAQLGEPDVHAVRAIIEECRKSLSAAPSVEEIESYLLKFAGKDDNEKSYLKTHLARYTKTLELLPQAVPGQTLLELGAAFHHITPALKTLKGYDVRCSDVWEGEAQITRDITSVDGTETHSFAVDNFDIERFPWPYPDRSFDVVMCCEMMEHLITDPMGVINEINRVLKPAGQLLVTTPNMASAKSVEYALRGESPYIYGRYEPGGRPTDHHNREYTTNELERLLELGGFQMERVFTHDSWWNRDRSLLKLFASRGLPIARRGDNTLCLAKRVTATVDRYPEEFYLKLGTQATRRDLQAGDEAAEEFDSERPLRILIANEMLPQTDRNGSDVRLMQIIREMREQGHQVTYLARNGYLREHYSAALEELGVKIYAHDAERLGHLGFDDPADWTLDQVLAGGKFDLAVLLLWFWTGTTIPEHYIPAIRGKSPNTRIAVLTDDQHGLRELRMAELQGAWADFERSENYSARELEIYRNADIVLSISEDDRGGLLKRGPNLNISLLPMMAELTLEGRQFAERDGILFLGNFSNAANKDGVQWIMQEVWPRVHAQLPDATLSLAGSNFPEGLGAQQAGVKPIGHVPDLKPLLAQHKLFVCPIRFGTGIKTKNLSALGSGLPLITTTIGAEGMNLRNGEHALIADSAEEFANAIVAAYTNEDLWRQLSQQGRKHISLEFGHKRLQCAVRALVQQARTTKPQQNAAYEPEYLRVEAVDPEIIAYRPVKHRNWLRLLGHVAAANRSLAKNHPEQSLAQLRHIFSVARDGDHAHVLFDHVLDRMARCYRQLGKAEKAQQLEQQKRKSESSRELRPDSDRCAAKISVIIPTYNRSAQLKICLANLAAQSLPAHQWELIIVDDGSTDNTKRLCSEYAGFCNLEYIQQQHSGTGAALQAAVERAKGEYLLFIQDDTILSSSMLADHLRAQYQLNGEQAAVVGNRAYPQEATENALNLFIAQHPLFFMQSVMPAELIAGGYYLMGSHFSIAKKLLVNEGSFDPAFEAAADIELAVRLHKNQCRLMMRTDLRAEHNHLYTSVEDLVSKAERYGAAQARLFRKYPSLVGDGIGAYGKLDSAAIKKLQQLVKHNRQQVREHTLALEKVNAVNLRPLLKDEQTHRRKLESIMQTVKEAVPMIYWTHFFASFLETWTTTKVKAAVAGD
jgi:glycosyltransferase involved in cell wall biosynthesis/2-polyprenyl-3-methyl-5-hydroxy-6-metoxy-1,4-benzoquinol methylase